MNALPYLYIPPDKAPAPVLVVVPHAGTRVGRAEAARIPLSDPLRMRDTDLLAERLVDTSSLLGAHLIVATVSRWVCDVDRDPTEIDGQTCNDLAKGRGKVRATPCRRGFPPPPADQAVLTAKVGHRAARWHGRQR